MSNLPNLRPPQAPVIFTTDPSTLLAEIEKANAKVKQVLDDLVADVEAEDATFENVLLPIMLADNEWSNTVRLLKFPASSSPDKAIRDASRDVAKIIRRFESDYFTREDIFLLVDAVMQRAEDLDPEQQYCLEKRHRAYILNGLGLTDQKQREHFKAIQTRLKDCVAECGKNMNEASGGIWFSPQDLDGLAPEMIQNLQQGEEGENAGKAFLTFKRPDLTAALTLVRVGATRKAIWIGSEKKCMENVPLIKEIFELRDEAARLLGYANHAALKIADKMMKSPDAVHAFLQDLRERTTPGGKAALEELVQLKKEDLRERGSQVSGDEKVYLWDYNYYSAKLKEKKVSLDTERLLEYMPLEPVLAGMFDIYERLFGTRFVPLRFDEAKGSLVAQKVTWHPDVRVFEVWDADEEGSFLGYLYLDMHPRFGKYSHQAHYRLQRAFTRKDGHRSPSSSVLMTNFSPPILLHPPHKPSLLTHAETTTAFHELGHAIHNLVSTCRFADANACVSDFMELPSKLLEHWFWLPAILRAIGRHYSYVSPAYKGAWEEGERTRMGRVGTGGEEEEEGEEVDVMKQPPERIPEDLLASLVQSRFVGSALAELKQLHFAAFDMVVHSPGSREEILRMDFAEVYNRLRTEIALIPGAEGEEGWGWGNGHARFGHMFRYAGEHDAGADAYAADLYASAFQADPMDPHVGRRYRREVLAPGGSVPEMQTLERFLGRTPNAEAYYALKGLGVKGQC